MESQAFTRAATGRCRMASWASTCPRSWATIFKHRWYSRTSLSRQCPVGEPEPHDAQPAAAAVTQPGHARRPNAKRAKETGREPPRDLMKRRRPTSGPNCHYGLPIGASTRRKAAAKDKDWIARSNLTDTYTYQPLPQNTIRILTLWGGNPDDPLTGLLELAAVDDIGAYEPLSYVWGNDTLTHKIRLPDAELSITASLYHALRQLRLQTGPRRVWADQICIDQGNEAERSQQVQFMNRIYRGGSSIQVWLGLDEHHLAEKAFGFVRELAGLLADKKHPIFKTASTDNLADQSAWKPLKNITDLPWFQRGWIVQEIGTKAPATLLWGKAEMAWDELHDVCEKLAEYHYLRVKFKVATSEIKYLYRRFVEPEKISRHDNRFSFLYGLHRARHLKVSDDRDRVFAMLGHYSIRAGRNSELKALTADYSSSVEEVYTDVAVRALIGDDESLITLGAVQHTKLPFAAEIPQGQRGHTLPSWVPDWRTHHGHIMSEPTSPHRACGLTKPNMSIRDSKVLEIRGIEMDRIEACSDLLQKGGFHDRKTAKGDRERAAIEVLWTDVCGKTNGFDLSDEYAGGGGGSSSSFFAYTQTLSNGCMAIYWQDHALEDYGAIPQRKWLAHAAAYLAAVVDRALISPELCSLADQGDAQKWGRAATGASSQRKFARTTKGYYVMGPGVMEEGDVVYVLFGGKMPFCLRPCLGSQHYLMVGECYMHGFMNGESVDMLDREEVREEVFRVV
ncbi:hypothetical protein GGTG_13406 [Gaeumannomyces tritici R3-111a-1]|uniref:Heterokaryon incompatibility domain-containing protein n=1 Tax=Gaeumannomyces tritici (strain R3-111a-1) TaxID=644352 RepID=J3PIS7_GAET3|nr:hypothetical protein GGTG_13406 [Gaeumannomyces tritici R3-111a-1]EJT69009.1 hypothetical protein GGTG_13406 [Gaeumannomyces tritici R3-111a-1]